MNIFADHVHLYSLRVSKNGPKKRPFSDAYRANHLSDECWMRTCTVKLTTPTNSPAKPEKSTRDLSKMMWSREYPGILMFPSNGFKFEACACWL